MKYIDELNLASKKVLIRCDFDVPVDEFGKVVDDHRLEAAAETIRFAQHAGASVVTFGHLGRPKGKKAPKFSLRLAAERLSEILGSPVQFADSCVGPEVEAKAGALKPGEVLMLENVRYHDEEEKNDPGFAKKLASLGDVFINNAFATSHRSHASCEAITRFVEDKAGGLTLKRELDYFSRAMENPQRPLLAIFGGAKVSTKMKALKFVGAKADRVIVGGAMANTFLAAQGLAMGKSLVEQEYLDEARDAVASLTSHRCELILPIDAVVAPELRAGAAKKIVPVQEVPPDMMALDIGPESIALFTSHVMQNVRTIVWNGPMGAFEIEDFSNGTYGLIDALAASPALTVVGGGDTDLALERRNAMDKMDFVSTAGGAFLALLEGEELPAVKALE